jgi:hypothetical protein
MKLFNRLWWRIIGFKANAINLERAQHGWICEIWITVDTPQHTPERITVHGDGWSRLGALLSAYTSACQARG